MDSITTGNKTAADRLQPYTFSVWRDLIRNNAASFAEYNAYVVKWQQTKTALNQSTPNDIKAQYIDALNKIRSMGTTGSQAADESDLTDSNEISTLIPVFAKKLKEIARNISQYRVSGESSYIINSFNGTNNGITRILPNNISTTNQDITVDVEELWGIGDPTNIYPTSSYDITGDISEIETFISSRLYTIPVEVIVEGLYGAGLTLDAINSIEQLLATNTNDLILDTNSENLQITSSYDAASAVPLRLTENYDGITPNLYNIIQAAKQYLSTSLYSASAGQLSEIIEPLRSWGNDNNSTNVVISTLESKDILKTRKEIGGHLLPNKIGSSVYIASDLQFITSDGIFADPNVYDTHDGIVTHQENVGWLAKSFAYEKRRNTPVSSQFYQKFDGYRAAAETNINKSVGVSRAVDPTSFWSGDFQQIWTNGYNQNALNLDDEKNQFFVTDKYPFKYTTDIFGNSYLLLKDFNTPFLSKTQPGTLWIKNAAGIIQNADIFFAEILKKYEMSTFEGQIIDITLENQYLVIELNTNIIIETLDYDYDNNSIITNASVVQATKGTTFAGIRFIQNKIYIVSLNIISDTVNYTLVPNVVRYDGKIVKNIFPINPADTASLVLENVPVTSAVALKNACLTGNKSVITIICQLTVDNEIQISIIKLDDDES